MLTFGLCTCHDMRGHHGSTMGIPWRGIVPISLASLTIYILLKHLALYHTYPRLCDDCHPSPQIGHSLPAQTGASWACWTSRTGRQMLTCGANRTADPGLLTWRGGEGSETSHKFPIKLDAPRVTGQPSLATRRVIVGKDLVTFPTHGLLGVRSQVLYVYVINLQHRDLTDYRPLGR